MQKKKSNRYKVISRKPLYDGFLPVEKATIEFTPKGHRKPIIIYRENINKTDGVAVLVYNRERQEFVFVKQYRYAAEKHNQPFLIEIPAGIVENGEDPDTCAKREVLEETGYQLTTIQKIGTPYLSPGYSTERTHLYFAQVTNKDKISEGGGLSTEHEDIEIVHVKEQNLNQFIIDNRDAKTLIALLWYKSTYC